MISKAALDLHRDAIVIDLHADILIQMRAVGYDPRRRHRNWFIQKLGFYHTDFPRWRDAGMTAQFLGLVTFPYPQRGCAAACFRQIERMRATGLPLVGTAAEIREAKKADRMVGLFGIEGAHNLEDDLDNIDRFYAKGVRYIGLAHFSSNKLCPTSGGVGASREAGLTEFGREAVRRMNRIGMLVDLAHVGRQAFLDAAKMSTQPVIVSHTGIHGVKPLWRNIDDEQIRAIADTGGVLGIIFAWRYLGSRRAEALIAHMDYVRRKFGPQYVALGSDYDGAVEPVWGLEDVAKLPLIPELLLRAGWPESDVRAALGENVLRVLTAISPAKSA